MYVSGGPYSNKYPYPPFYPEVYEERRRIRSTSNSVCLTALAGIFLLFLLPIISLIFLRSMGFVTRTNKFDGLPPVLYYIVSSFNYLIAMAVPALLYFSAEHVPISEGVPFHKVKTSDLWLFVALGCFVCLLANFPADWVAKIQQYFGFSGSLPSPPLNNDPAVLVLYAINIAVVPPLVEELMYRGVILQSLRRFGDGFAVLVSAILFGLYHGNFIQMVFAFFCGLAMGYVVVRTDSLLPSILIHFINNGISVMTDLITRYRGAHTAGNVSNVITVVVSLLGIAAIAILTSEHKLFGKKGKHRSVLPLSSRLGAAFGNFGGVIFMVYAFLSSIYCLYHY